VTDAGRQFRLSIAELHHGLEVVGAVAVPKRFDARNARSRKELAQVIDAQSHKFSSVRAARAKSAPAAAVEGASEAETNEIRRRLRSHPCHSCPDREDHARWAERYFRTARDKDKIVGEIQRATGSIARVFDKRCAVLVEMGYLEGEGDHLEVTPAGIMMRTLYAENDIVMAECLRGGVWNDLNPAALAAAVSTLLYSGRRDDDTRTPRIPGGPQGVLGTALRETVRVWSRVGDAHTQHRLPELPSPQWGIVGPIHGWAQGKNLDHVLRGTDIAAGDMVRWCKQVIDALDQIAQVAPSEVLRSRASHAIDAMRRGVVAY
jgi:ATP-dependent RNA helicase HelY